MKYNYLESFRGLMALWVVLLHGFGFLPLLPKNFLTDFFYNGYLPVVAFIILSGFVTHILLDKGEIFTRYIIRRAFRLFPIYLVALGISIFALNFSLDILTQLPFENPNIKTRIKLIETAFNDHFWINIISHVLLLHGVFPDNKYPFTYTLMGQSWSLTLEWQFYLFIPFIWKYFKEKNILSVIPLILMMPLIVYSHLHMPQKSFLPYMIQYFLIGYIAYYFFKMYLETGKYYVFYFLSLVTLGLCFIDFQISIMIAIFSMVLLMQANHKFHKIFSSKFLIDLGKISYSMYCIHLIVFYIVIFILLKFNIEDPLLFSVLTITSGTIFTIVFSKFSFRHIEKPLMDFAKKI
ncbi:acyltransferase family protein [Chryseobacterium sp. FH1]|uniref:acyltransferase family protein n=1 Tax=Chryseobacterium sp. FH1 TaxID=1233951 RepID=UPI0004E297B5|nr:acyltransferase [Chryseobacterium sp. FH1]KFC23979.1 hypothetical protein IO90_01315 [Chryseobacterium sp. FH1]